MKPHKILKTFKGTQTGHGDGETFEEGTVRDLSKHLAEVVVPAGFAEPVIEARETKVVEVQETKPAKAPRKK